MSGTMAPSTFVKRRLTVQFDLLPYTGKDGQMVQPTFDKGQTQVTHAGLRVSANIRKVNAPYQGDLDLRVFGMSQSDMLHLCRTPGTPNAVSPYVVTLLAGDEGGPMKTAYQGTVTAAWVDYAGTPEVPLHITAFGAMVAALKPVPPSSYPGGADVAQIMSDLAGLMGFNFENNGVSGIVLHDPYLPGTAYEQAERAAEAADIEWVVDDGTLAIWPKGGHRSGDAVLISPSTGMVGYPSRTQVGVEVTTIYNPHLRFGSLIQVETSNTPAAGTWRVLTMNHALESETPNGAWFSGIVGFPTAEQLVG